MIEQIFAPLRLCEDTSCLKIVFDLLHDRV